MADYIEINRKAWNYKTPIHIGSEFYDNEAFLQGKNTLQDIELSMLGDIKGKSVLHLQCHFGQDSISLARMGANVTAIDLSDEAIKRAQKFAGQLNVDVEFICSDIYNIPSVLDREFDIVFTSYGVIGWLPDIKKWSEIVSHYLKPQGRFIFVEFHPLVWVFDDNFTTIAYDYFNTGEIIETFAGTYADRNADVSYTTVCWNHSLSEVMGNLINSGIEIKQFEEFDYSPYPCFKNVEEVEKGKFKIKHLQYTMPMVYALEGMKR